MKKLIIALGLGLTISMFNTHTLEAQHISVNINLDYQPAWGPYGYEYAEYYYFPNLNIYYDVNNGLFVYLSGRRWVSSVYLPKKYRKYDLYMMYKVVLNDMYHPWTHNNYHQRNYAHYRNNRSQVAIYYVNDRHYHMAKRNHWAWVEPRYMPKQTHNSHKHLAHQHKPVQVNKNPYRSSASNNRSAPNRNQNQVSGNNRSQKRNDQSVASSNRVEGRSSNARTNESRSSANKQNEVRKNENKQVQKTESRNSSRNNQTEANKTKRTETRSSGERSSNKKEATVEKRSAQKEKENKRSTERTNSNSRSSSRSSGSR